MLRGCAEPAVIHGLVEQWPAFSLWAGRAGLQRLSSLAGHVAVEVIHGTSNGDYYGDILGHERSVYSFTRFLDCVGDAAQNNLQQGSKDEADRCAPYLAQAEMFSSSASAGLYPKAVFGESPNHSCVNFRQPDSIRFPKHASVASLAVAVILQAGDALFIPEGWWHQVTSVAGTSAVNFWWQSKASAAIGGANDSFYLRHVMGSMIATEKTRRLDALFWKSAEQQQRWN
eukprot:jgi/Tetstr1/460529/TSEL_005788.t2